MSRASDLLVTVDLRRFLCLVCLTGGPLAIGCERPTRGEGTAPAVPVPLQRTQQREALPPRGPTAREPVRVLSDRLVSGIVERTQNSVVNIFSTRTVRGPRIEIPEELKRDPLFRRFFEDGPFSAERERERQVQSLGSGVVVSRDGLILTNSHVVEEAEDIRVAFPDGREFHAEVLGADPKSELAVLRVLEAPSDLEILPFGDSTALDVGEFVLAIGNPFGVGQTVTFGIVSGTGRANLGIIDYEDFIQTDAAINPGNSGGPLVNLEGEVVGITTAILSETGMYAGIGFAIPSNMARIVMDDLIEHGRVIRGWLGVAIQDLTPELAQALGLETDDGALVSDVTPGGPAATAGLRRGDVIVALGQTPVESSSALRNQIAALPPGTRALLEIRRDGDALQLPVTLREMPSDGEEEARREEKEERAPSDEMGRSLGLTLSSLTDEIRSHLEIPARVQGAVVVAVQEGTPAERAGLLPGDVIVQVARAPVRSAQEATRTLQRARGNVLLLVWREGSTFYTVLEK